MPTRINSSGFVRGNSITSLNSLTWSVNPPISVKSTKRSHDNPYWMSLSLTTYQQASCRHEAY